MIVVEGRRDEERGGGEEERERKMREKRFDCVGLTATTTGIFVEFALTHASEHWTFDQVASEAATRCTFYSTISSNCNILSPKISQIVAYECHTEKFN